MVGFLLTFLLHRVYSWQRRSLTYLSPTSQVKERLAARDESYKPFAGLTMAMIFTKPSMRTRVSFETVRSAACAYLHPFVLTHRCSGMRCMSFQHLPSSLLCLAS